MWHRPSPLMRRIALRQQGDHTAAALSGGLPTWSAGLAPPLFACAVAAFTFWRA